MWAIPLAEGKQPEQTLDRNRLQKNIYIQVQTKWMWERKPIAKKKPKRERKGSNNDANINDINTQRRNKWKVAHLKQTGELSDRRANGRKQSYNNNSHTAKMAVMHEPKKYNNNKITLDDGRNVLYGI